MVIAVYVRNSSEAIVQSRSVARANRPENANKQLILLVVKNAAKIRAVL
jgi:hypothetical protein